MWIRRCIVIRVDARHHHEKAAVSAVMKSLLRPSTGTLFHISPDHQHRFMTSSQGSDLVVFHPDHDIGFSDHDHPRAQPHPL